MRVTYPDQPEAAAITIEFTEDEMRQLGADAPVMVDWLTTALTALVALRSGATRTPDDWHWQITALSVRLLPRLGGILAAAIRAHAEAGGSYGDLAIALDAPRSTAQRRRDAITDADPSQWEVWATSGAPRFPTPTT